MERKERKRKRTGSFFDGIDDCVAVLYGWDVVDIIVYIH